MRFDSTKICDYWHIPQIVVSTADFLTFQMLVLVLIGAEFFRFVWKSQGIYSLWKVATMSEAVDFVDNRSLIC
jgi:hypothetical protein